MSTPKSPVDPHDWPLVGISSCRRSQEDGQFHVYWCNDKYPELVARGAGALPLIIPSAAERGFREDWVDHLVARLNGLVLTGSRANVEPHHYGRDVFPGDEKDPDRDATILPLAKACVAAGIPVYAICRGIQELNVALGGTLHQKVFELPGRLDHRSDKRQTVAARFDPRHEIFLRADGPLAKLAGDTTTVVNSLHGQAIDRPAPGLTVEAWAADGTIEAVSVTDSPTFAIGIQWHAEWDYPDYPLYAALAASFGEAVHAHAAGRRNAQAHGPVSTAPAEAAE